MVRLPAALALICFLAIAGGQSASAQIGRGGGPPYFEGGSNPHAWISAGIGAASGPGVGLSAVFGAAGYVGLKDGKTIAHLGLLAQQHPTEPFRHQALHLGGGRLLDTGPIVVVPSAGPAIIRGRNGENDLYIAPGFLANVQAFITPIWFGGFGAEAFILAQFDRAQIGFRFSIQLGNTRGL